MSGRTPSQAIPTTKRVYINDANQLPSSYSTTPGGTMYSTTPGGTRLVYERETLMNLRNSPLSRTPPNIPHLPECISKASTKTAKPNGYRGSPLRRTNKQANNANTATDGGEQFEIDI